MREQQNQDSGDQEEHAGGHTTPHMPATPGLPKGAREALTRGALPPTVLYKRCKHLMKGNRQCQQKSGSARYGVVHAERA